MKILHQKEYPDYKYKPRRKTKPLPRLPTEPLPTIILQTEQLPIREKMDVFQEENKNLISQENAWTMDM